MRFKQRLKVIQSLEDTAKRSVVWMDLGSPGPGVRAGAGVGTGTQGTAPAKPPQAALRSRVQGRPAVLCGTRMQKGRCRFGDVGGGLVTVICCRLVTGKPLFGLDARRPSTSPFWTEPSSLALHPAPGY